MHWNVWTNQALKLDGPSLHFLSRGLGDTKEIVSDRRQSRLLSSPETYWPRNARMQQCDALWEASIMDFLGFFEGYSKP
jgi:hypothetical protein